MAVTLSRREAVRAAGLGSLVLALGGRVACAGQPAGGPPAPGTPAARVEAIRGSLKNPSGPFTMLVRLRLRPGAMERFLELVRGAIAGTATETGVVQYDFHQSTANPDEIVLIEQWRSADDLLIHFETEHLRAFSGAMSGLTAAPTEVQVLEPIGPRAVDTAPRGAGFYRFSIGDIKATVLSDGHALFRPIYPTFGGNLPKAEVDALLESAMLDPEGGTAECSPLLLDTTDGNILIDTGAGSMFGPTLGKLWHNLTAAGVRPEDINAVVLTHAHPDHIGGLFDHAGRVAFPNAEVFIGRREHDFWMGSPELPMPLPDDVKRSWIGGIQERLRAYGRRVRPIGAGEPIVQGVSLINTPGHTPGHSSVVVESASASLVFTGDVVLHHVLGVQRPDAGVVFDADPALAERTRRDLLAMAARERRRLMVYHAPWPGLGRVRPKGDAFEWVFEPMQWA